jgi:hypothetical protein
MAKRRPTFTATDTRNWALVANSDERACAADGESTREVPRALPIHRTRACARATNVAKATAARQASRRGSVQGGRAKGSTLPPKRCARVRGCTGTRVCVRAHACACRGHDHGGDRNGDNGTATETANARKETKKEDERGFARGDDGGNTYKKSFPSLARRPASPTAGAVARW